MRSTSEGSALGVLAVCSRSGDEVHLVWTSDLFWLEQT